MPNHRKNDPAVLENLAKKFMSNV